MSKGSWGRLWRYTLSLLLLWASPVTMAAQPPDWGQFWNDYQKVFLDSQGRVIDWAEGGVTTSEGQSYALFFALVANQPSLCQNSGLDGKQSGPRPTFGQAPSLALGQEAGR